MARKVCRFLTRTELAENNQREIWILNTIQQIPLQIGSVSNGSNVLIGNLEVAMKQMFQLTDVNARITQASQSLLLSLEHVRAQLNLLSLGSCIPKCDESSAFKKSVVTNLFGTPYLRHLVNPVKEL